MTVDLNGKSEQINLISINKHDLKRTHVFDDNIVIRGLLADEKIMGTMISNKYSGVISMVVQIISLKKKKKW